MKKEIIIKTIKIIAVIGLFALGFYWGALGVLPIGAGTLILVDK